MPVPPLPVERLWAMRYGGVVERVAYFLVVALFNVFPLPKLSGFRESFNRFILRAGLTSGPGILPGGGASNLRLRDKD